MEKELSININDYTALQLLYLLMFLSLDKTFELKIKELIKFMEKNIYKNFFKNLDDFYITSEEFKVKYTFGESN